MYQLYLVGPGGRGWPHLHWEGEGSGIEERTLEIAEGGEGEKKVRGSVGCGSGGTVCNIVVKVEVERVCLGEGGG